MKIHDNTYYVPIIFNIFRNYFHIFSHFMTTADFVENTLTEIWVTLIYIYMYVYIYIYIYICFLGLRCDNLLSLEAWSAKYVYHSILWSCKRLCGANHSTKGLPLCLIDMYAK